MLNTIEEAIQEIREGKLIIVVDHEDRENEGDLVTAARNVTPEIINFMSQHGRGLICVPLSAERAAKLNLHPMVQNNNALHQTAFTVSVDLKDVQMETGISSFDRARTIQALINPKTNAEDLARPGHVFPLIAQEGGILKRPGHTEAAVDLAKLAGFEPAGAIVEIINDDGTMARLPDLLKLAKKFNLKIISIEDLVKYLS